MTGLPPAPINPEMTQSEAKVLALPGVEVVSVDGSAPAAMIEEVPEHLQVSKKPELRVVPDLITAGDVPFEPDTSVAVGEPKRLITSQDIPENSGK